MTSYESVGTKELVYPDYYGGAFIDDDGHLNIRIKGNASQKRRAFQEITKATGAEDFRVLDARYSYDELNHTMNMLNELFYKKAQTKEFDCWAGHRLSEEENCVVVEIFDLDEENASLFRKQIPTSEIIRFENSNSVPVPMIDLNPSAKTTAVAIAADGASIGYRGKRFGNTGFVTTGHFVGMNHWLWVNSLYAGKVVAVQNYGSCDFTKWRGVLYRKPPN